MSDELRDISDDEIRIISPLNFKKNIKKDGLDSLDDNGHFTEKMSDCVDEPSILCSNSSVERDVTGELFDNKEFISNRWSTLSDVSDSQEHFSECRIIAPDMDFEVTPETGNKDLQQKNHNHRKIWILTALVFILTGVLVWLLFFKKDDKVQQANDELIINVEEDVYDTPVLEEEPITANEPAVKELSFTEVSDTVIENVGMVIFHPRNAVPKLVVGTDVLNDSTAVLVTQAADIRRDNGEIVGSYVVEGKLLGRGRSKSGFCAILDGNINIGIAETTPMLERAIERNGYFFRQYPLVVGNQVIENKPKNRALRKALAVLDDEIVVIMSKKKMTFHEFSQSLVDLGVSEAIYLIGSNAYGFARDKNDRKIEFGSKSDNPYPNSNYIVWY